MSEYPNANKSNKKKSLICKSASSKINKDFISDFYGLSDLKVERIEHEGCHFNIFASSSSDHGICPYCNHKSRHVHNRYKRRISDLSILGEKVTLTLESRKFFCRNEACGKKTFAEQPGNEVFRYRRYTRRLELAVTRHGISLSCGNVSKVLSFLGIGLSPSTVLRFLLRLHPPVYRDVSAIGVDDWAWRKGMSYGSIVIDLDTGFPVDLLGDRKEKSFRRWMDEHGNVRLVSRDRSTDYSSAIASTGRPVVEVADKFHLIKNISQRLADTVSEHYSDYRLDVLREEGERCRPMEVTATKGPIPSVSGRKEDPRMVMFREVKELRQKGFCPTAISKKLHIARQTATKYYGMDELPGRVRHERRDFYKYDAYVEEESGKERALAEIYKEVCAKGFRCGSRHFYTHYKYLSDRLRKLRARGFKPGRMPKPVDRRPVLLPPKAISDIIARSVYGKEIKDTEELLIKRLLHFDWFSQIYNAAKDFYRIITGSETGELIRWMKKYWKTQSHSLKTFLVGIKLDFKAVQNTIRQNVTNGITEGFVNKVKVVKRIMYGRAGIDLLKRKMVMEHILFN